MPFQSIKTQQMANSAVRLAATQPIIYSSVGAKIRDLFRRRKMIWRMAVGALVLGALGACDGSGSAPPPEQSSSTVAVSGISPSVLTKGDPQIISSVDSQAMSQSTAGVKINTLQRDLVGLMVNKRVFAYAIRFSAEQTELSPTSTAVYMVLKLRELTQLPSDKLTVAVADIKSHPNFADFVAYIKFSVESGMPDPLNPQTNFLLLKKMRPIAESIAPAKYSVASAVKINTLHLLAKLSDVLIPSAHAATANEFSCTGAAAEICGTDVSANTLGVNNFRATPYMAYPDNAPDSMWDSGVAFGRAGAIEKVPLGFTWNGDETTSNNLNNLWQKIDANGLSFDRGSAASTLQLTGIGTGTHKVSFRTMGVCRFVGNTFASLNDPSITPPIDTMSNAQWAAMFMNMFSLAMITADTVAGAEDILSTRKRAITNLKGDIAPYTAELKGIYAKVKNSKQWVDEHKGLIRGLKFSIKFLNELSDALKSNAKLDVNTRASWENLAYFSSTLQEAVDVFDAISDSGELNAADKDTFSTALVNALQNAGLKWASKTLIDQGAKAFLLNAEVETADNVFGSVMTLGNVIEDIFWGQSGVQEVHDLYMVFLSKDFTVSRAIGAFTTLANNPVIGGFFEKAFTGAVKEGATKAFGKQVLKHLNAVSKAVSTGWAIGTKMLPAWLDSCTAPEKLELDVINGQISSYGSQKIQIRIDDLTSNTTLMDFNEIDGTPVAFPASLNMIDGHTYRYTVRGFQDGVLDRSRDGTDATHRSLDANVTTYAGGRSPQNIWSVRGYRDALLNGVRTNVHYINQFSCVKRLVLGASFQFSQVRFTGPLSNRHALSCNDSSAYADGVIIDPDSGDNYAYSTAVYERLAPSWLAGASSVDWSTLVRDHADMGFGHPFKITNDVVHTSAQDVKSLGFAFGDFTGLGADRIFTLPVNTLVYRIDGITCGTPVVGQPMTCTVKGAGLPLTSSADFALSSTACASFVEGTLAADPTTERRFVCTPVQFGSQTLTLAWNKLVRPVVSTIYVAATAVTKPALSPATDTGRLANDGITNNRTPVLMGTAPPYSTADIYNGTIKIGSTIADASGNWQFAVTNALGDGVHSISVRTTQGGVTVSSPAAVVTVDATAPTAPTIAQALRQANGTVTASGLAEAAALVSITWPDGVKTDVVADATTGAWSATSTNVFAAGASVTAKATDLAGNASGIASALVTTTPTPTGRLPDTGITSSQCYAAGSDVLVNCTSAAAIALNSQQDGMVGRDVVNNDSGDGKAGFSYSLVPDPSGINGLNFPKTACVKDNITGLVWEGKPADGGYRDYRKAYTNYGDGRASDVSAYIAAVNAAGLCGASNWRLPEPDELQGIVDYGVVYPGPTIDATWFPNTQGNLFWSSSPHVASVAYARVVIFYDGSVRYGYRYDAYYVRLVRAGQ